MEETIEGVHRVGAGYVNAYVVDGDQGVVLVDTGLPKRHGAIEEGLDGIGRSPSDVVAILLTHSHADHGGGAAHLKRSTGAPLFASPIAAPSVRGDQPIPPPPMMSGALAFLSRFVPTPDPVDVDHEVDEANSDGLPDEFTMLDTPGHTPGHVSYLLDRAGGVLLVGDAAIAKGGDVAKGFMNKATPSFRASIAHIGEHDFDVAVFGHSGPIVGGASAAFARYAAAL